ncbi:MAG: MFS transporter [Actinomycetota bacterium]
MSAVVLAFHRTFDSMRVRNFRIYLAGMAVSTTGIWIHTVASAWLVLRLSGSGVALGLLLALEFLPILVLGAFGGVVADRFDKRRTLIVTQTAFAVLALSLGALVAFQVVQLWMVYAVALVQGLVTAVDHPTRQAFVPEIVGKRNLANAVGLNSAVFTGTRIVGPAIGAGIIAAVGIAPGYLLDGVSYLAVVVSLCAMRSAELRPAERAPEGERGVLDGLRYVWSSRELRLPLLLMSVLFTFSFNWFVFMPLLAERTFDGDARTYGLILSMMGVGSFVGALVLAHRARPGRRLLALAAVAVGVLSVAAGIAPTFGWELGIVVLLGLASIAFMITGNTTLQLTADPAMRGRVMSLYSVVFLGSTPIGAPIAGWVGEHLGARTGLILGGLIAAAGGLTALWALRRASRTARERAAEHEAEVVEHTVVLDTPAPDTEPAVERSLSA